MPQNRTSPHEDWPNLPVTAWDETRATLHMWTQIIGKIRLAQAPMINHWWQVPLYVTSRGLTTSPMPHGARIFQIDLDFVEHGLRISVDDGRQETFVLQPRSVADFYAELMGRMRALGLDVRIWTMPVEIAHPIRFEDDLRVTIQALGWRNVMSGKRRYLPLQDDIASVGYWYQAEPHAPFPTLPDRNELEVI